VRAPPIARCGRRQIARFVAQGPTNRQVAEQLFLSREPPFHLREVFCNLGISSRHELGSFLHRGRPAARSRLRAGPRGRLNQAGPKAREGWLARRARPRPDRELVGAGVGEARGAAERVAVNDEARVGQPHMLHAGHGSVPARTEPADLPGPSAGEPRQSGAGTNEDVALVYRADDVWLLEDSPIKTRLDESSPAGTVNSLAVRLLVFNYFAYSSERFSKASATISGTKLIPPTF
jgi:hypothetical protein